MKVKQYFFLLALVFPFLPLPAVSDDTCPLPPEDSVSWKGKVRVNALKKFDEFLFWSLGDKLKPYPLVQPLQQETFGGEILALREFETKYGYFSSLRPIVAKVTTDQEDLRLASCLLKTLYEQGLNGDYLEFAIVEVLTKVVAYRDLQQGEVLHIPVATGRRLTLEPFVVDRVFDIWKGMPAFGLIPEKAGLASILLFRGTDLSLLSQRGWASIMSDLDSDGPGLGAFQHARKKLRSWLQKVREQRKEARTMGFSLGGALAAYLFIYENALLSTERSVALCSPGVADKVIEAWHALPLERQGGLVSYVNAGDIIPKVGKMFGTVYCLAPRRTLRPLRAHTVLMSGLMPITESLVDVAQVKQEKNVSNL